MCIMNATRPNDQKIAVVTGAAHGIGKAIAKSANE